MISPQMPPEAIRKYMISAVTHRLLPELLLLHVGSRQPAAVDTSAVHGVATGQHVPVWLSCEPAAGHSQLKWSV